MNRLPHKGHRVRFWELGDDGVRRQQTGTVVKREKQRILLWIDGRTGMFMTPTRPMEILKDEN